MPERIKNELKNNMFNSQWDTCSVCVCEFTGLGLHTDMLIMVASGEESRIRVGG